MTTYWFPAAGHPDGLSPMPWFRIEGLWGYRAIGHPEGESREPCLKIVEQYVYATFSFPNATDPCFEVSGSFVYPPGVGTPWFVIKAELVGDAPPESSWL